MPTISTILNSFEFSLLFSILTTRIKMPQIYVTASSWPDTSRPRTQSLMTGHKTLSTRLDINYDIIPVTGLAIYYPV